MRDVYVASVGMIPFGRHYDLGVKQLTSWVTKNLFDHSPLERKDLQAAWMANAGWGMPPFGQHCIRGQVALSPAGIDGIPIMNVENACASASSAFHGAYLGVASGAYDVALAIGVEKMAVPKDAPKEVKKQALEGLIAGTDVEVARQFIAALKEQADQKRKEAMKKGGSQKEGKKERSPFMDLYSMAARAHMKEYGTTQRQLAVIAAKNHHHGALNPDSQYKFEMTPEEVLGDIDVSYPLTRAMCAPIGDGAAAAILVSGEHLKRLGDVRAVKIRASVLGSAKSGTTGDERARSLAAEAYERAGLGPEDMDLAEVHDATAFGELSQTENMGFCDKGQGGPYAESGATSLGGAKPVNPSGGLESRGHPIGATGLAMIAECVYQLRGQAGERQVPGARIALTENGGGMLGAGEAAMVINVLEGPSA